MSVLSLSLLGPFQATLDGQPLDAFRTSKVQALLVYLATEDAVAATETIAHRREALIQLLWPGLPRKSGLVNLRQTLYQLRRAVPELTTRDAAEAVPFLLSDRYTVQINPAADLRLDVRRFHHLLRQHPTPDRLTEAVALYRGDFLCDVTLPDSGEFENWAAGRRAAFQRQVLDALDTLMGHHIQVGNHDQAQTHAWQALEIDDLRESAYRGLMTALAAEGKRTAALAQYQICQKRLRAELGVAPSAETTALYQRIQSDALRDTRTRQPPPVAPRQGMPVFLLTDIEGSTPLWETHREAMLPALLDHNRMLEEHVARHGGRILELRGDGVKAVFEGADPLPCALAIQRAFGRHDWGAVGEVRIRIGLHGEPPDEEGKAYFLVGDQYYGPALHHAARIMDAGHGGQILVSESVRNTFPLPPGSTWQDLGEHPLRGVEDPQRIFGLLHPDMPLQAFPPLRTSSAHPELPGTPSGRRPPPSLPTPATPLVGRESELADLEALIANPDVRLITIVGPGGVGKTRLAVACAERELQTERRGADAAGGRPPSAASSFPNGVVFLSLAALSEVDQIVPSLADALNFRLGESDRQTRAPEREDFRTPRELVLDYLREKRMLLIMDNFEHLLSPATGGEPTGQSGADLVADILQTAPEVQILATSRERLQLHEEQVYPLAGLAFPSWERPDDTADYTAARLFLASARRVQPGFELAGDDLTHLARICRLLEGMPLALELAAGWVDVLSLADIAVEIQRGLDVLETDWRDVPRRHRSMRAAFDASWQGLSEAEQGIFAQLCVFRGGFTRHAARKVAGADLRSLSKLGNKSLVEFNHARGRYTLHALLRQYGAERLAASPRLEAEAADRHSDHYCSAMQAWEADLKSARQLPALAEVETDIENVRTAWAWAAARGHAAQLDRALDGLVHYYRLRVDYEEIRAICQQAARALTDGGRTLSDDARRVLCRIMVSQAEFDVELGHRENAERLLDRSLELLDDLALTDLDIRRERALILTLQASFAHPDFERCRELLEQSITLWQALGDQWHVATGLLWTSIMVSRSANPDAARSMYRRGLAMFQALGDRILMARTLLNLGWFARRLGDYDEAERRFKECLALCEGQGEHMGVASSLEDLGYMALFRGHFEAGAEYLERSLALFRERGHRYEELHVVSNLGAALWLSGDFVRAEARVAEAEALVERVSSPFYEALVATFRGKLDMYVGGYADACSEAHKALVTGLKMHNPYLVGRSHGILGWIALAEQRYAEAERRLTESLEAWREQNDQEYQAWALAGLGATAQALKRPAEARRTLLAALEIVTDIRAFIPLLHLIPVIPALLIEEDAPSLKERAVELAALAESNPFIAKGRLFEDIAGRGFTAACVALTPKALAAAQARGQALDWWVAADDLLSELQALGWGEGRKIPEQGGRYYEDARSEPQKGLTG